jgi:hypothetical protein
MSDFLVEWIGETIAVLVQLAIYAAVLYGVVRFVHWAWY